MGGGLISQRGACKWEGGLSMREGLVNGRGANKWEEGAYKWEGLIIGSLRCFENLDRH